MNTNDSSPEKRTCIRRIWEQNNVMLYRIGGKCIKSQHTHAEVSINVLFLRVQITYRIAGNIGGH